MHTARARKKLNIQDYTKFAKEKLGLDFKDEALLLEAFTHRSYLNEHRKTVKSHNERLEFLGDAVLELAVTEHLFKHYNEPEGMLTSWRSALVRTESIGDAARRLGMEAYMRLSRGERQGSERARRQILANAFEALIGAIYLDQGYDTAKKFIEDNIIVKLKDILEKKSWRDSKSLLQEIAQSRDGVTPTYKVLKEEGPDHDKNFTVGVFVGDRPLGQGNGPSKQAAQQAAAENGLRYYGQN